MRPVDGPYTIRWSRKPISEEGQEGVDFVKVAEGQVPTRSTTMTANFTIPEAAYGVNYVQLIRAWRPEAPYGFSFSVLPDVKVSPASGSPGAQVTVKGSGFPANNKEIILSFDGKEVKKEITSNELGSFSAQFTIPETIAGRHQFEATLESTFLRDTSANFEVRPTISLEPKLPEIGKEVTLSGIGFAASSPVTIKYDDLAITGSPVTSQSGSFSHKFNVPESSKDNHVITATDKAGNTATYGLPLEGAAPPVPTPEFPIDGQRFGWFGPQPITFRWDAVSDPSGVSYTLEIGRNVKVWPPVAMRTNLADTTCSLELEPGTYFWRVKAVDGAGNESAWEYAPYPFKVGMFSVWYLIIGGILFLFVFALIVRAFFRRLSEYIK